MDVSETHLCELYQSKTAISVFKYVKYKVCECMYRFT